MNKPTSLRAHLMAKVPELKSKPSKRQIVMLSTITAGFFAIFLAFFLEYVEKVRVQEKT